MITRLLTNPFQEPVPGVETVTKPPRGSVNNISPPAQANRNTSGLPLSLETPPRDWSISGNLQDSVETIPGSTALHQGRTEPHTLPDIPPVLDVRISLPRVFQDPTYAA